MIKILHRVNKSSDLKNTPSNLGIEVDIRSNGEELIIHHDPFKKGELFTTWIKSYKHKLIVLNVKEEGLENKILKILKKNKIKNYFFHDQTFSSLLKSKKKMNVSLRYSEYEDLKKTDELFDNIKWLWIDNFNEIKLKNKFYFFLKKKKVKICIVSPELVNKNRLNEIKKLFLYFKRNNFFIDAVCTKNPEIWMKLK